MNLDSMLYEAEFKAKAINKMFEVLKHEFDTPEAYEILLEYVKAGGFNG